MSCRIAAVVVVGGRASSAVLRRRTSTLQRSCAAAAAPDRSGPSSPCPSGARGHRMYHSSLSNQYSSPCRPLGSFPPALSRRAIGSTPCLLESDTLKTEDAAVVDDDPCPAWQNPLHHNNPDYNGAVLSEDFAPGDELPVVPLPPFSAEGEEGKVLASQELHDLADEIVQLNMLEVKELVDRMGERYGFVDDGGGGAGVDGGEGAEEEVVVEEKTAFDVMLTAFEKKGKIKVIKEVRSVAGLGLKEAKDLVEGAPSAVMKNMKKEEAEELKAKLEALGATVEIV